MTAPAVAWTGIGSNAGKVITAETLTAAWSAGPSGSAPTLAANTTNFVEGTQSLSEKTSATAKDGYTVNTTDVIGEPFDFSSTGGNFGDHIFAWITAYESEDTQAAGGFRILVADDLTTDSVGSWYVGPQSGYLGGWTSYVINPSAAFDAVTAGTGTWTVGGNPAQLSGVDGFGAGWKITKSITGNVDNTFIDAIVVGTGYEMTLGDAGSTEGVFADFITFEQVTSTGRYGGLRSISGILFAKCKLIIGDQSGSANTEFIDSGFTVVWEKQVLSDGSSSAVASGFYELKFVKDSGTTDVTLSSGSLQAVSPHFVRLSFNGITSATITNVSVDRGLDITLDTAVTWDGGNITNCGLITMNGGILNNCNISAGTMAADGSQILWNTSADPNGELDGLSITKGTAAHHAIEFDSNAPLSITLTDVTFTGFNAANAQNDSTLNFTDGSGKAYTVNISGGSTPSYKVAGTSTVSVVNSKPIVVSGVTEGTPVTIHADDTLGTRTKGDLLFSGFADSNGEINTSLAYEAAFDPDGLPVIVRARNQGVAVAVIAEDNGTSFTDQTSQASSNTIADMTLLPAVPAGNDAYYFGHTEQFAQMKIDVSTVLTQSSPPTFTWEYYNGTIWTALSGVSDGTSGFETAGENIISWTMPGNWATQTVNSQGPFYYVRVRLSTVGTITQVPVGRRASLDVTRYLPYARDRFFTTAGLSDVATWTVDTVSQFGV